MRTSTIKRGRRALSLFLNTDLSAFYFDIRKDTLYCDPLSSQTRRAALDRASNTFSARDPVARADPRLHGGRGVARRVIRDAVSVHLEGVPGYSRRLARRSACGEMGTDPRASAASSPARWRSSGRRSASVPRWKRRRTSTSPNAQHAERWTGLDFAEVCITSAIAIETGDGAVRCFQAARNAGRRGRSGRARAAANALRSWKISPVVGSDPEYPDCHAA